MHNIKPRPIVTNIILLQFSNNLMLLSPAICMFTQCNQWKSIYNFLCLWSMNNGLGTDYYRLRTAIILFEKWNVNIKVCEKHFKNVIIIVWKFEVVIFCLRKLNFKSHTHPTKHRTSRRMYVIRSNFFLFGAFPFRITKFVFIFSLIDPS